MQENTRQAVVEQILEEGATTIMLRSLPASTTTSSLMTMLGLPVVGFYDFLYRQQCSRQPNRIVEMAFINFVDQSFARLAVQLFQEASTMIQSWSRTRVSQARVQGLAPNLAYFLLRFGEGAMLGPDAPLVFANGVPASLQDQCAAQINEYAIRSAWLVIQEETQPRQRDMRSQRLPGDRAGVRDKVEPILVAPNLREDELLDLARRHEERFGFAIFRL